MLLQISQSSSDDRAEQALAKLKADGVLDYDDTITADFVSISKGGSGVNTTIGFGDTTVCVYRLDKKEISSVILSVKSDGNTSDFIKDYLINGTYNKTFGVSSSYYYVYSENAIYDYNGLENLTE